MVEVAMVEGPCPREMPFPWAEAFNPFRSTAPALWDQLHARPCLRPECPVLPPIYFNSRSICIEGGGGGGEGVARSAFVPMIAVQ